MLRVTFCRGGDENIREVAQWQIGEPFPVPSYPGSRLLSVEADGKELLCIARNFTGIPMWAGGSVTWRGEWAEFIATHLSQPQSVRRISSSSPD